jgi:tRNA(adenine34) deaminase
MREAIRVATSRGTDPASTPIGAVIVLDGEIIARAHNECDALHDPTAHAEMVAFRRGGASVANGNNPAGEMRGATLYSTLQPCGMCTMASIWAKVGRVVYGAGREDVHRMYFEARHTDTLAFIADAYRDDIGIEGGVLRQDCAALYFGPDDAVGEAEQGNL